MNLLAIDYGLANIGLAISTDSLLAQPLHGFKSKSLKHTISTVSRLIHTHHIDRVILGRPTGKLKTAIEHFGQQLLTATSLPIEYVDEEYTTNEAIFNARQAGKKKAKIKTQEHSLAAAVILQSYLDSLT